jgi:hypothetical protein
MTGASAIDGVEVFLRERRPGRTTAKNATTHQAANCSNTEIE